MHMRAHTQAHTQCASHGSFFKLTSPEMQSFYSESRIHSFLSVLEDFPISLHRLPFEKQMYLFDFLLGDILHSQCHWKQGTRSFWTQSHMRHLSMPRKEVPITVISQSLGTIRSGFILQSSVTGVSIFLSLWEPVDSSNEMLKS